MCVCVCVCTLNIKFCQIWYEGSSQQPFENFICCFDIILIFSISCDFIMNQLPGDKLPQGILTEPNFRV